MYCVPSPKKKVILVLVPGPWYVVTGHPKVLEIYPEALVTAARLSTPPKKCRTLKEACQVLKRTCELQKELEETEAPGLPQCAVHGHSAPAARTYDEDDEIKPTDDDGNDCKFTDDEFWAPLDHNLEKNGTTSGF
ncbi:hypothetical protein FRB94_001845 [Tulasnella sp. JGI-2019a]|nr:hypothetical protein FRB94_001845 [Tulasnella sp. JGI-2019a]